jgi:hypothetical protein
LPDHADDDIREPGPADDPPDQAASEEEAELLFKLTNALVHISSELDEIRGAIQELRGRDDRAWAALKRIESMITQMSKQTTDEGEGGF